MSAKKKTVFKGFDYMHCDDFARFLNDMAAKGWHFMEWGVGLKFEKGEPEQVTYAVEVFTDASEYDLRPEPHTKAFAEYCEVAGWKLIDAKKKFCIFKRVQEDAIPILTEEERMQNVYKESRRELIPSLIISIIMLILQLYDTFNKHYFAARIFSPLQIAVLIGWAVAFLDRVVRLVGLLWQKHKMKQTLATGESIYLGNKSGKVKVFSRWGWWLAVIVEFICIAMIPKQWMVQLVLFFMVLTLSILILSLILAKLRPESNTNYIIQTVFGMFYIVTILTVAICFGELERQERIKTDAPLLKDDYVESDAKLKEITLYDDSNIFGRRQTYFVSYEASEGVYNNGIHYDIYSSENDWIMDKIWTYETKMWVNGDTVDCADEWDADIAFYDNEKGYFVRYENMIFFFEDYDERILTKAQIGIIRDKIGLR